ncbi:MAG: biopolymer transporter ExbD [Myxococcota bacterium]
MSGERWSMFGPQKHHIFGGGGGGDGVDEFAVDLNLTPLMDVMSNILFFLLAGFGAAIISFLAASVPLQSDSDAPADQPKSDKVTVNLQIVADAYKIGATGDKIPPEDLAKLKQSIPKREGGAYDNETLTKVLYAIKQKYPASDTIMILPVDSVVYEDLVAAMEASKESKPEGGQRIKLFPKAVIADVVKGDTEGGQ